MSLVWWTIVLGCVGMIALNAWCLRNHLDALDAMPEWRVTPAVLRRRRIVVHWTLIAIYAGLLGYAVTLSVR